MQCFFKNKNKNKKNKSFKNLAMYMLPGRSWWWSAETWGRRRPPSWAWKQLVWRESWERERRAWPRGVPPSLSTPTWLGEMQIPHWSRAWFDRFFSFLSLQARQRESREAASVVGHGLDVWKCKNRSNTLKINNFIMKDQHYPTQITLYLLPFN